MLEAIFLLVLWYHADTIIYCPLRQRTPSLKLLPSLVSWSIASAGIDPLSGIRNNLRVIGPDYMLGSAIFLPVLWSHGDTIIYCPLRQRTPSLKLLPPLVSWSIASAGIDPLSGIRNNLRVIGPDYMLGSAIFLQVLWSHADTSSCLLTQRIPSSKLPPPLVYWSIMNAGSEPWIKTSNNRRELSLEYMLGVASVQFSQVAKLLAHPSNFIFFIFYNIEKGCTLETIIKDKLSVWYKLFVLRKPGYLCQLLNQQCYKINYRVEQ